MGHACRSCNGRPARNIILSKTIATGVHTCGACMHFGTIYRMQAALHFPGIFFCSPPAINLKLTKRNIVRQIVKEAPCQLTIELSAQLQIFIEAHFH